MFFRSLFAHALCFCLAIVALTLIMFAYADPAFAQVVSAPAAAPTVVQVQPFLHVALTLVAIVVLALIPMVAKPLADAATQKFHLSSAAVVSDGLTKLAYDAVHFGENYCDQQVRTVKGIDVGDPKIAAAANWLLVHASDEIAHLNLTDQEVINTVKAILPQAKPAPISAAPAI